MEGIPGSALTAKHGQGLDRGLLLINLVASNEVICAAMRRWPKG